MISLLHIIPFSQNEDQYWGFPSIKILEFTQTYLRASFTQVFLFLGCSQNLGSNS